jgi:UDP-glucose 4-epimerase
MSLEDALILWSTPFRTANRAIFSCRSPPASTIGDLARALIELFSSKSEIKIIGTRHGEKLYETLVTREEMVKAIDLGGYYRIPADNRDLNYDKYFFNGETRVSLQEDYNSHNTQRLNVKEIKELISCLNEVKKQLIIPGIYR